MSLTYTCGCRDVFGPVEHCPDDQVDERSEYPCVPESCQSCQRRRRPCPGRQGLYRPIAWEESNGVGRVIKRKMPGTGTQVQPWERDRQKHMPA